MPVSASCGFVSGVFRASVVCGASPFKFEASGAVSGLLGSLIGSAVVSME